MATYYAINEGGAWHAGSTWSTTATKDASRTGGATAPTSGDACILDDYSGNVTVSAGSSALTVTCTGYTGTLTYSTTNIALVVYGDVVYDSTMTLAGTGTLRTAGAGALTMDGLTFPGALYLGADLTLVEDVVVTGILTFSTTLTIAGAFDITCGTLKHMGGTVTFPDGHILTVTTAIAAGSAAFGTTTIQSTTAEVKAYIAYTGADASAIKVGGVAFTDIDFSTHSTPVTDLDNWYGGTLTRTVGITNRTSADIGGGVATARGAYGTRMLGIGV